MLSYADHVYDIIKKNSEGLDSIYEDYILALVGVMGLDALKTGRYLETCGVVNGRQLYVLCEPKEKGGK